MSGTARREVKSESATIHARVVGECTFQGPLGIEEPARVMCIDPKEMFFGVLQQDSRHGSSVRDTYTCSQAISSKDCDSL